MAAQIASHAIAQVAGLRTAEGEAAKQRALRLAHSSHVIGRRGLTGLARLLNAATQVQCKHRPMMPVSHSAGEDAASKAKIGTENHLTFEAPELPRIDLDRGVAVRHQPSGA
jgi:hypothetical protein